MIEIKEIPYGIACRIENIVYLNKDLKKDIPLYCGILNHELEHSAGYSWKDILIDIKGTHLRGQKRRYFHFVLTHPSSWIEFLPCWRYEGKLIWNPSILSLYGIILVLIGGIGLILKI